MVICCPNAGYYEYMYYENEWIDFYMQHNMNVFVYNYRGYGNSSGSPTPGKLRKDGEKIIDYLRNDLGVKKIGVHGESIGGMIANHIANTKEIDFLFADRTFYCISKVGEHSFSKKLTTLYRQLTLWDDVVISDYLDSKCYKVMTYDP
mmetsp:Transcript_31345/g.28534  ORF Transcript_31345/g.28534 Transcript_31345/m.28534 type:complete len:148 (-) Transcript_31345:1439-1882(-)|eukprot:CAMPEP_0114597262 /NCGR_PEP_ID=MMETSP0125-20121206/19511_1 /TAXON_ID=485358 ORGANISM="Aristerostoma sp., Strain ATCC 50986" /NCGR_SAMPLE_ID=MMETSP0125 /ASSEMBLY_ACC=CAM_ASM_000245 /LENGTH=147 /DNA_ID=CAMNT_0001801575 /DNA_START=966 /DNA_END=1409 /DNA_ORIENTATION=+